MRNKKVTKGKKRRKKKSAIKTRFTGYLEEDDTYLIEETVESSDEEETRTQMEVGN